MKDIPVRQIPTSQQEPGLAGQFNIHDLRPLMDEQDMIQELHRHNFYYLLVLQKGVGSHEIDFTPLPVTDNTLFFMRPGQVHRLTLLAGSKGYLLSFRPGFFPYNADSARSLSTMANTNHQRLSPDTFASIWNLLNNIATEFNEQKNDYFQVIKAHLHILFIHLARQQKQDAPSLQHSYTQQRLDELTELLDKYITTHKQVTQYAALLNLSVYQLNAITKTTTGKTCSALINDHIILEAKRYLLATTNQVNQVAWHLGYEDVSYFIRFFKKHTGLSPDAFRNKYR
ncbi:helix-turn-helix transcriptional regulator [Chitinophaga pendula]|uniref:helix-turn-helix domain-containing protein n=1 Tax=Chitinophaga TaxID=79328 RepID=UPI000BAE8DC2|nr:MULTISPECIES: helix-turn-helix transcriptional regulator [Chitinophaga]ASZ11559.1 AraC family transcriptional regulator [Chitinophaga sp. MD30]UCJ05431.1 helix-turn-helix transcriptional regulator [Chitinophaga pendula]